MLPRCVKVTLYEVSKELKKLPADLSKLKIIYSGAQPTYKLHELPAFFLPDFGHSPFGMVCEATMYVDKAGRYEFQYGVDGQGELYVDNRLVIDREKADKGAIELGAGSHPLRFTFCGKGGATIILVDPQGKRRELVPQDLQPMEPKT